ncbi:zinc-binding dehydrogenase [Aeromicrobium sp. 636]|uniref:Zinc-dependent alcohol dehydrogenase family protein n=1 Tax=Aeromicrobium senzhongii TaxID=2663859 RepID=A0A8I0K1J9_9ACTN|nr:MULTISPECIES: zinc-dependent alcohol dehydrogenase family protein [Aeromicrobium]MBC9224964.1 zinc-dependent alcohol dehydrogenase family protein [Aeromicrobium senzhongii]MCQ3997075.1 zinc-binding dehydrogenase [Aeromicrobium sp. 636]MTB87009.1 zinc-binding dehydrogenase [Aeromicrobium senzhongii]QNL93168.1 zinc-dependent alcohol dehydrogenase family protein [Aeromicrobium senzhongii]
MRATVLHSPGDIRLDTVPDPVIEADTDAIVRVVASCVCGSDLWPYRGLNKPQTEPHQIGHEQVGIVESVGTDVSGIAVGDFVIAPFMYSDNTCVHCRNGVQTSCVNGGGYVGCQAELVRVPQADGTLVTVPGDVDDALLPHLLALTDVFPTGHHAAFGAGVTAGSTVAVVGDGAVGLSAVLAAKRLGAATVVAMSRHEDRQQLARRFGADHIVETRGKEGAAEVREILDGIGADAVLECVGTGESMKQAFLSLRPGGTVGYVGVPHGVELNVPAMFGRNQALAGGVAPVRRYLDELLPEVLSGALTPGDVFDLTVPLDQVADAYRAMDERTAIKALLKP